MKSPSPRIFFPHDYIRVLRFGHGSHTRAAGPSQVLGRWPGVVDTLLLLVLPLLVKVVSTRPALCTVTVSPFLVDEHIWGKYFETM